MRKEYRLEEELLELAWGIDVAEGLFLQLFELNDGEAYFELSQGTLEGFNPIKKGKTLTRGILLEFFEKYKLETAKEDYLNWEQEELHFLAKGEMYDKEEKVIKEVSIKTHFQLQMFLEECIEGENEFIIKDPFGFTIAYSKIKKE